MQSNKCVYHYIANDYCFLACTFIVSPSVINATAMLGLPHISASFHSVIVTCTIHVSSEADECLVTVAGDNMYRSGMLYVCMYIATCTYMHISTSY